MAGLTDDGLIIRTQPELAALFRAQLSAAFPGVNFDQGPEQQMIDLLSEELAIGWETLAALYGAYQGRADGQLLDLFAAITGTTRRAATFSRVACTVNLNAGKSLVAGKVASVAGNPDAQFALVATVTNAGGSAADVDAVFQAVKAGPVAALSGSLTVIVTPSSGWNSLANALDAEKGLARASDTELSLERRVELAGSGSKTYASIRAAVAKLIGVISVSVIGNETLATDGDGRPGKSFEVLVWDNTGEADDDAIAQAIYDKKPEGIEAYGITLAHAATETAGDIDLYFTRATVLRGYAHIKVILVPGADSAGALTQATAALSERAAQCAVGETLYWGQLVQHVMDVVPAVKTVTFMLLGTTAPGSGVKIQPTYAQIVRVATGDIVAEEA